MKLKHLYLIVITSFIFYSCAAQKVIEQQHLKGVWNSVGYGQQLEVSNKYATLYDVYKNGCNINLKLPLKYLNEFYTITKVTKDSLQIESGFTKYNFTRSTGKRCEKSKNNPLSNFDALWNTFNENYASFELRDTNWELMREKYRSLLSKKSSDTEVFNVLNQMVSELNDGHSSIDIPEYLEDDIEETDDGSDVLRAKTIQRINTTYIKDLKTYNKGMINWGKINDSIAYIQFNDFEDLANYNISNQLSTDEFEEIYWENADNSVNYTKDVINSFKAQMKIIFDAIKDAKTCIIDVRFNGGGFDEIGLEILSYFTDKKTLAFTKKAKLNSGFTTKQTIYIYPNHNQFKSNVYLLTSFQTASASETFVLASQNLKNIKCIGSNTEGILSDILSKRLPNGWEYGLSNEVYENYEGVNYEKIGIPPHYNLNYSRNAKTFYSDLLQELKQGDRAIEKVLELN